MVKRKNLNTNEIALEETEVVSENTKKASNFG
jgi:hypothetical protein